MNSVGIHLGDGHVGAVVLDADANVVGRAGRALDGSLGAAAVEAYRAAVAGGDTGGGVGITLPFSTETLPDDLTHALARESGAPPIAVQAGHALALAETWCGAAQGCRNVITFAIGEHVTAGVLVAGSLLNGAHGHAGSVAWMALNPVEREDYRRYGGLEAEVAAAGIVRRLVWRIKSGDTSRVVDNVAGDLSRVSAEDVFAAARDGDGVCISVVRDTARYVGIAVANLATILDPECVVLGGTLASSGDLMLDAIRAECSRRLRPAQRERIRIDVSTLGPDAPAIGAARAALLQRS